MGKSMAFEELQVWQVARRIVTKVYGLTAMIKDYGFDDQIQRAAISIMNNIAEGYESGTTMMLKRYFMISKGSCGEVRSMLYAAIDLNYILKEDGERLIEECRHLSVMIKKFIDNRR